MNDGSILIMATPMTLKEAKFNRLMKKYEDRADIVPVPCPGLMEFIEEGKLKGEEVEQYLLDKVNAYKKGKISSIVLGCTHYPFIEPLLSNIVGEDTVIIDGGLGTAKELKRRLSEKELLTDSTEVGKVEIINSLDKEEIIDLSYRLLEL